VLTKGPRDQFLPILSNVSSLLSWSFVGGCDVGLIESIPKKIMTEKTRSVVGQLCLFFLVSNLVYLLLLLLLLLLYDDIKEHMIMILSYNNRAAILFFMRSLIEGKSLTIIRVGYLLLLQCDVI